MKREFKLKARTSREGRRQKGREGRRKAYLVKNVGSGHHTFCVRISEEAQGLFRGRKKED
jgi:hypothetical protein